MCDLCCCCCCVTSVLSHVPASACLCSLHLPCPLLHQHLPFIINILQILVALCCMLCSRLYRHPCTCVPAAHAAPRSHAAAAVPDPLPFPGQEPHSFTQPEGWAEPFGFQEGFGCWGGSSWGGQSQRQVPEACAVRGGCWHSIPASS